MSRPAAVADAADPTPEPSSAVTLSTADTTAPDGANGRGVPFEYFANPTPEMLAIEAAIGAAYEEGRALYGDEDGDAWIAALENGTHPLCRIKTAA
jgi:hypothetical protein